MRACEAAHNVWGRDLQVSKATRGVLCRWCMMLHFSTQPIQLMLQCSYWNLRGMGNACCDVFVFLLLWTCGSVFEVLCHVSQIRCQCLQQIHVCSWLPHKKLGGSIITPKRNIVVDITPITVWPLTCTAVDSCNRLNSTDCILATAWQGMPFHQVGDVGLLCYPISNECA